MTVGVVTVRLHLGAVLVFTCLVWTSAARELVLTMDLG